SSLSRKRGLESHSAGPYKTIHLIVAAEAVAVAAVAAGAEWEVVEEMRNPLVQKVAAVVDGLVGASSTSVRLGNLAPFAVAVAVWVLAEPSYSSLGRRFQHSASQPSPGKGPHSTRPTRLAELEEGTQHLVQKLALHL